MKKTFSLNTNHQLIILLLLAFSLNINTLFNKYTLDDSVVMTENRLVEKGVKGIPEILTTDLYYGTSDSTSALSEARYRPFSLAVFAIEHQFFGENPFVSHLINVLLFALLITLLFRLLQAFIFREQHHYLAFFTCILFVVHPIHTEVIASVKSRDELITYILLVVSLLFLLKHIQKPATAKLIISLLCFFLALLTRESAITYIAIAPLVLYFFFNRSIKQSLLTATSLFVVTIFYLGLRFYILKNSHSAGILNVFDSPFLFANSSEALATKFFILLKYLGLLFFPHPLSWDYGYNQIPYIGINSFRFILSFTLLTYLMIFAILTFNRKSIFSFCILYFFITISLCSNISVDIGTPLSERLLFQPSLAFCIVIASLYIQLSMKFKLVANTFLLVILLLFCLKTVIRNADWKNNETLFLTDVISSPNSIRTNNTVASIYLSKAQTENSIELKNEYFKKTISYCEKTIKICPTIPEPYVTLGTVYYLLSDYNKATNFLTKAYQLEPTAPCSKVAISALSNIYFNEGNRLYRGGGEPKEAIRNYLMSIEFNKSNIDAWYNLSKCYSFINDTKNAEIAKLNALKLEPKY